MVSPVKVDRWDVNGILFESQDAAEKAAKRHPLYFAFYNELSRLQREIIESRPFNVTKGGLPMGNLAVHLSIDETLDLLLENPEAVDELMSLVRGGESTKSVNADEFDIINRARHYNAHPSGIEAITLIEDMPSNLANAAKYLIRREEKGTVLENLQKAEWYLKRELDRITRYIEREKKSGRDLVARCSPNRNTILKFLQHEPNSNIRRAMDVLFTCAYIDNAQLNSAVNFVRAEIDAVTRVEAHGK